MGDAALAMRMVALLLATAAVVASESAVEACSCGEAPLVVRILPEPDATAFPTDGRLRVFVTGGVPPAIKRQLLQEFRLLDADGRRVELSGTVERTLLILTPREPLRPRTRYLIQRVHAYSAAGERLSFEQRLELATKGGRAARRLWAAASHFTTGDGPTPGESVAPSIAAARVICTSRSRPCAAPAGARS